MDKKSILDALLGEPNNIYRFEEFQLELCEQANPNQAIQIGRRILLGSDAFRTLFIQLHGGNIDPHIDFMCGRAKHNFNQWLDEYHAKTVHKIVANEWYRRSLRYAQDTSVKNPMEKMRQSFKPKDWSGLANRQ